MVAAAVIVVTLGWLSNRPPVPEDAPDFSIETIDGDTFSLADHKGGIVVLNFWGTWCPPCVKEIPEFNRFAQDNPNVTIIGVAVRDNLSNVTNMQRQKNITYPLALAQKNPQILQDYEMGSNALFPTTFVINANGMITSGRVEGGIDYETLADLVADAAIAE